MMFNKQFYLIFFKCLVGVEGNKQPYIEDFRETTNLSSLYVYRICTDTVLLSPNDIH